VLSANVLYQEISRQQPLVLDHEGGGIAGGCISGRDGLGKSAEDFLDENVRAGNLVFLLEGDATVGAVVDRVVGVSTVRYILVADGGVIV